MSWLKRIALNSPGNVTQIVQGVASNQIAWQDAATQLAGIPEACSVIQTAYQTGYPGTAALYNLAKAIQCDLVGEPQNNQPQEGTIEQPSEYNEIETSTEV